MSDEPDYGADYSRPPRRMVATISFTIPRGGATRGQVRAFIKDALETWGGQFHPTHPLQPSLRRVSITNMQEQEKS